MKLKPGLFQLIVFVMTVSLLAACATTPEAKQTDCVSTNPQNPQQPNCSPSPSSNSSGRSSGYFSGGSFRGSGSGNTSEVGSSRSTSKGRSGFGSFGRGGHAGG